MASRTSTSPARTWVVLLLVAALGLATVPAGQAQTRAAIQLSVTADPGTVSPGGTGVYTLTLKNAGNATAYGIHVEVRDVDDGLVIPGDQRVSQGGLAAGSSTTTSPFRFKVNASAPPGVYQATFEIDYRYNTGSGSASDAFTFSHAIRVQATPALLVEAFEPNLLEPGGSAEGAITLANRGSGTFTDILGTWSAENKTLLPFGGGNTFHVDALGPGEVTQVPVQVAAKSGAAPGLYAVTVGLTYRDAGGAELTSTSTVGVEIGAREGAEVLVSIQEVGTNSVTLAATNIGVTPITGVQVQLLPSAGFHITGRDTAVLGNLAPGAFLTASYTIDRLDDAAEANVSAKVRYTDRGGAQRVEVQSLGQLGIPGTSDDILVTVQEIDSDTLLLAVSNVGTHPITGVQVRVLPGDDLEITNTDTIAVGNLEPGAFGTAAFEVEHTGAIFPFRTTAQVVYTDEHGDRQTHTQEVQVAGPPNDEPLGGGNGALIGAAAVLLVVAAVAGIIWHRRRRKAEEEAAAKEAEEEWERLGRERDEERDEAAADDGWG